MIKPTIICAGVAMLLSSFAMAADTAQDMVSLLVNDRPPYTLIPDDGNITGVTASVAAQALKQANIPYKWVVTPLKRQFFMVQSNRGLDCAVGLLKNSERAQGGKFSKPLYRDKAYVALVRSDLHYPSVVTIKELLNKPDLRLLVKDGLTYGTEIHALIKAAHPKTQTVVTETDDMLHMVASGRADWMLLTVEEAAYQVANAGLSPHQVSIVRLSDVGKGEYRYLYCSNKVGATLMQRMNAAIPDLPR